MEHVIFGFGTDISRYPKMEIFLYLILFSLMLGVSGKVAYEKRMISQYSALVRYGKFSIWWHYTALWVLGTSVVSVLALFGTGAAVLKLTGTIHARREWITALSLWLAGFCTMTLIQSVLIQLRNGYKTAFALFMCMEVVSLYRTWLPGNWLMYERSYPVLESGFPVEAVCLFQAGIILLTEAFGYVLFKPGRNHEFGN